VQQQQLLQNLNSRLEYLESRPSHGSPAPKVALPDKFDGNIQKCKRFLASVENIFSLQPDRYYSDEIKTRFIGTLLTGDALSWFSSILEFTPDRLSNYFDFVLELSSLFGDPHAKRHACDALKRLRQSKFSVLSYSTKFRGLAFQTGYNEDAKMDLFRSGLNEEVKDVLATSLQDPETLEELISLCIKIDQRLHDRRLEKRFARPFSHSDRFRHPSRTSGSPGNSFVQAETSPVPMDLDSMQSKKVNWSDQNGSKKLSSEERTRRIQNNLCLYCGDPGHQLANCSKRKTSINALALTKSDFNRCKSLCLPVSFPQDTHGKTFNALLDSGANSNFISRSVIREIGLQIEYLVTPVSVRLADGSEYLIKTKVKEPVILKTNAGNKEWYQFSTSLLIVPNLSYPVILGIPWFKNVNPQINWNDGSVKINVEKKELQLLAMDLINIEGDSILKERSSNINPDTLNDSENIELNSSEMSEMVPKEYHDLLAVFEDKGVDSLPPKRSFDLEIQLKDPDQLPPFLKIYRLSQSEEILLKKWIDENVAKGLIRPSKSPVAAPIFFVPKKDGGKRPCIDYRILNKNTVTDAQPMPLISEIFGRLGKAKFFTTLDLKGAYNLIRMKEGSEWLAAFRCQFGLFEPLVVQFGLTNAPAVFQRFVNSLFYDMLDTSVVVYLDDILIFSDDLEIHITQVRQVLKRLINNNLVCKLSKCKFHRQEVMFLGHILTADGIKMDPEKQKGILEYPAPQNLKQVRSIVGMANYYRKFIPNFSELVRPLTELTKKNHEFVWSKECIKAFEDLKKIICSDLVLAHPQSDKEFSLYTDASDFALGAVLTQVDVKGDFRPVEFFSRKLLDAERNYSIYDKELLAIIEALKEWRHFLIGAENPVEIFCDHNNLKYFNSTRLLKPRHCRWAEFLSQFNFVIVQIAGQKNVIADFLSRSPHFMDSKWSIAKKNELKLLKDESFAAINAIQDNYEENDHELVQDIAKFLSSEDNIWECEEHPYELFKTRIKNFIIIGDRLYYKDEEKLPRLVVLKNEVPGILERFHNQLGHLGAQSIMPLIKRRFYWDGLERQVEEYCKSCDKCQLARSSSRGIIKPAAKSIPPVAVPFERWGIDFLQNLPITRNGNRHCITMIDYATRWVIASPVKEMNGKSVVKFLYYHMLNYGTPVELISDRGSAFLSEEVQQFLALNRIKHSPSTAYHPQTNGMVERCHQMINHGIVTSLNDQKDRWDEKIDSVIWALRIRKHSVTGKSPFYLLFGTHPRLPGDLEPPRQVTQPLDPDEYEDAVEKETADRLEELGQERAAAYLRSLNNAKRRNSQDNSLEELNFRFAINDWVKLKNNSALKFDNKWIGPLVVVDYGHPGTYWLMYPDGRRLDNTVNQERLAPWISNDLNNANSESVISNGSNSERLMLNDSVPSPLEGDNDNMIDSETLNQAQP
jgi:transposase InsO family protein